MRPFPLIDPSFIGVQDQDTILPTTMSGLDHTRSLQPYKPILRTYERPYRDSDQSGRPKVLDDITEEIMEEARGNAAKVADGEVLRNVCAVLALQNY